MVHTCAPANQRERRKKPKISPHTHTLNIPRWYHIRCVCAFGETDCCVPLFVEVKWIGWTWTGGCGVRTATERKLKGATIQCVQSGCSLLRSPYFFPALVYYISDPEELCGKNSIIFILCMYESCAVLFRAEKYHRNNLYKKRNGKKKASFCTRGSAHYSYTRQEAHNILGKKILYVCVSLIAMKLK